MRIYASGVSRTIRLSQVPKEDFRVMHRFIGLMIAAPIAALAGAWVFARTFEGTAGWRRVLPFALALPFFPIAWAAEQVHEAAVSTLQLRPL